MRSFVVLRNAQSNRLLTPSTSVVQFESMRPGQAGEKVLDRDFASFDALRTG